MNTHDSHEIIFPADPRITAYAFGELEGDELKLIEAAVDADPALQAAVAELRGFGDSLAQTLLSEPGAIAPISALGEPTAGAGWGIGGLFAKLPAFYYLAGGMAAAGFAVLVAVRSDEGKAVGVESKPPAIMELVSVSKDAKNEAAEAPAVASVRFDARQAAAPLASQTAPRHYDAPAFNGSLQMNVVREESVAKAAPASVLKAGLRADEGMAGGKSIERKRRQVDRIAGPVSVGASSYADTFVAGVEVGDEDYAHLGDNAYRAVESDPLSTFSIDVDTASYSNVRRFITSGQVPPRDAVRVEELINYFPYRYATPKGAVPFAANLAVASAPWAPEHRLVRIGIKGREVSAATRPAANLVFLLDVSGSMNSENKLPLVKASLRMLVERLRPDDRVAIVTYAGNSGLALPSTLAAQKAEILAALDNLQSGGSTNGAMGIHLAYDIAKANFVSGGGINRVILCTDGDFNVGVTDRSELVRLIEEKAKSRVFLSVFGFGMGNLKDNTLESLADKGNGAYGYIDSRREAEKVFIEQVEGTLATIAKDVKIQVEFNPAKVASYRLIGYENRMLTKEDFNNDAVDAGDIGAGHTVTALYEVVPVGVGGGVAVDPLKYQQAKSGDRRPEAGSRKSESGELLTVKIRYKAPEGDVSAKQEFPLVDGGATFARADGEFHFAAAVAAWGMLLRDSPHKGTATFEQVLAWAEDGLGDDAGGHRAEFVQLVRRSAELK